MRSNRPAAPFLFAAPLLLAVTIIAISCSSGSSGGNPDLTIIAISGIDADGTLPRNRPVRVEFSTPIDPETVSINALTVRTGGVDVPGRIEIAEDRRSITWFPTVLPGDRNDYFPRTNPPINGIGLTAFTNFKLKVLGDSPAGILSKRGKMLEQTTSTLFRTTDGFEAEDPPVPPTIDPTQPVRFDPAPLVAGDPASADPADWPVIDPSAPMIELRFSEAIAPATALAMDTVLLTNITMLADPPFGVGEAALIETRLTDDARGLVIDPLVSLGDDPDSADPFEFEVRIRTGVTDLAGNALGEEIVLHFLTADKPGEPNFRIITETFDDDSMKQDASSAIWGNGELVGAEVLARTVEYHPMLPRGGGFPPPNTFNLAHPLIEDGNPSTPFGNRFQMRFPAFDIQPVAGEVIVGMAWSPKSGFVFGSAYRDITMKVGLMQPMVGGLLLDYDANYDSLLPDNPLEINQDTYWLQSKIEAAWEPWPEFTGEFAWEPSTHDLVFEFILPEGGDTYQLFNNDSTRSTPLNRMFSDDDSDRGQNGRENTQYSQRFDFVSSNSIALSKGYDSKTRGANYEAFLIVTDPSRTGTSVTARWAGTEPGAEPVDVEFVDSLDAADNSQAIAFRLLLRGNSMTGVVPRVESIHIAVTDTFE